MSYDPNIHTGESFDRYKRDSFGVWKQTVLKRYDGGWDYGSPVPANQQYQWIENDNIAIFGSAMWLPSIQVNWSSNEPSYHEHDWQLRVINMRIVAECECGETRDEDNIIDAL